VVAIKEFAIGFHNFELVYRIEGQFNRLILLRSDVWHLGESGFGKDISDCRLFQTFFFEIKGKYEGVQRQETVQISL
jgi:hypothetical protein